MNVDAHLFEHRITKKIEEEDGNDECSACTNLQVNLASHEIYTFCNVVATAGLDGTWK